MLALPPGLLCMSTQDKSFFRRIDIRFPWLKLVAAIAIGALAILDLLDLTISKTTDPYNQIKIAPMSHHVRIKRDVTGKMLIALTFDDGPSSATTPRLLDILYEKDVPATFFMLGGKVRNNPDIAQRAEKEGHIVASHTMYHQNLIRISSSAAKDDIAESKSVLSDILGHNPTLTRPPYGNINNTIRESIGTPIILWSVDTLDWKNRNVDDILSTTKEQIHDGAIILIHDIYDTSVDAVPVIIDELRKDGYDFVTVSELAKIRGVNLENGTTYYNFRL